MSSHFPSICSRVLPVTDYSTLPTSPLSFLKLNYPLASSCAAVLDSTVVFFIERRKGSSETSHHILPHIPPAENHSCLQANILSAFHCRFPDSLSCLGSKKHFDLGSLYHAHLVTSFCFSSFYEFSSQEIQFLWCLASSLSRLYNKASMKTQKDEVWRAPGLVNMWICMQGVWRVHREHGSSMPLPTYFALMHLFQKAISFL